MNNSKRFPIQLRFCDVDSLGHVNNAHYLSYFETARLQFLGEEVGGKWDWINKGIILRKNEVEYLLPVFLSDSVEVEISVGKIGKTSFSLFYHLYVKNVLKSKGESILVCYNFNEKRTVEVYPELKQIFQKYA
jgi:acyl-CoA thioester hydrolase